MRNFYQPVQFYRDCHHGGVAFFMTLQNVYPHNISNWNCEQGWNFLFTI